MEVCVDTVNSALNAEKGGATRIELCGSLVEGGTTPSLGSFKVIKNVVKIPVFVMIRPRGGDFLYTESEFEVMKEDIRVFVENNAVGFVFGILTRDGSVDTERCKELLSLCGGRPVTFHRAFDMVRDYQQALENIIILGFKRILTSGLDTTCLEGLDTLKHLVKLADKRIIIVPGGGINERNIARILDGCGATEFHCSARSSVSSGMKFKRSFIHMTAGLYESEYNRRECDSDRLRIFQEFIK